MNRNATLISIVNCSPEIMIFGAPTPKSVPSETAKTSVSLTTLIIPDWVHCEICKRREHNG
ncbi:unnamed protein product, partial [Rotaria magnacalcarata]